MPAKALFIPTNNDVTCTIITLKWVIQDKEQLESPYFGTCTFSIKKCHSQKTSAKSKSKSLENDN